MEDDKKETRKTIKHVLREEILKKSPFLMSHTEMIT